MDITKRRAEIDAILTEIEISQACLPKELHGSDGQLHLIIERIEQQWRQSSMKYFHAEKPK
jgi:hypothetical protein